MADDARWSIADCNQIPIGTIPVATTKYSGVQYDIILLIRPLIYYNHTYTVIVIVIVVIKP